jgi:hypothetical protein
MKNLKKLINLKLFFKLYFTDLLYNHIFSNKNNLKFYIFIYS